jgi:glycine cleavage system aminomethyltransferase T
MVTELAKTHASLAVLSRENKRLKAENDNLGARRCQRSVQGPRGEGTAASVTDEIQVNEGIEHAGLTGCN